MTFLGIDTGGTFTDFVLWADDRLLIHKVLSTPDAPESAILQGISELAQREVLNGVHLDLKQLRIVHGSTVATNAVLEGKGVRTAYITNRGFADLLTIGRQNRRELYNLQPQPIPPPVPRELCLETAGRLSSKGELLEPVTEDDLSRLKGQLEALAPEAVAVNLLFSYLDDQAEKEIARVIPEGTFISLSSQVLPLIKEYERGMATWLNAWIGPLVQGYLRRLAEALPGRTISVMQSSGETVEASQAGQQAVKMLLSGPAGGLVASAFVAEACDCRQLLSIDMGGTSTDVALIEYADGVNTLFRLTSEGRIGQYPVAVPMVDMQTIGAGGGSIAWMDTGGMLQVGPESSGAMPGPACYGYGGQQATVTDANLILGRLRPDAFLGGDMPLDLAAAEEAMGGLAARMQVSLDEAALGVIRVADEHMARALREISIQRGIDPREFTLVSFGGAGGLHVCSLAEALGLHAAMVPVFAGVLSALGMLVARPGRQLFKTHLALLSEMDREQIQQALGDLAQQGLAELQQEGLRQEQCVIDYSLDLRYLGQSYTLNYPWARQGEGPEQVIQAFHQMHQQRYGHRLEIEVELVNLRVSVKGPAIEIRLQETASTGRQDRDADVQEWVHLAGIDEPVPVYARADLIVGQQVIGPAVITERVSTTWVAPGWHFYLDTRGNLRLDRSLETVE